MVFLNTSTPGLGVVGGSRTIITLLVPSAVACGLSVLHDGKTNEWKWTKQP